VTKIKYIGHITMQRIEGVVDRNKRPLSATPFSNRTIQALI